ncbi:multiheme c-type cytochrome [Thermodesulfobacteriota bacterium]
MIIKKHLLMAILSSVVVVILVGAIAYSLAETRLAQSRGARIEGRVMSVYGPVENARVRVAGDEKYTLTDRQGRFELYTGQPPGRRLWVTAGKEGWFNNGQMGSGSGRVQDIFLNPIFLDDKQDYRFISPVTCFRCHTKLTRYWDKSKMAHTTSNPKVLDMLNGTDAYKRKNIGPGYRLDNPNSNGNCASCHAPSAAASSTWSQDLNTVLRSSQKEWDGISCDYCHKVRKVIPDKTKPSGMGAILERQTATRGPSILVFGPYDDVAVPPMAASYNRVYDQGVFCSTCHGHFKKLGGNKSWDYSKVYSETEWKAFGLEGGTSLPIQTTYQEWKQWQDQLPVNDPNKGKKCQDCHMSWRKDMLPYDHYVVDDMARNMWGTYRSPQTIHPHQFEGGTETQLKTALAMELEGEIIDHTLNLNVYITNTNGGHWVPTGETMRSVMLLVQVKDSEGKSLKMKKGERLPDWTGIGDPGKGHYAGLPGAVFARILEDEKGNIHVPFWRATGIASDTRIRPKATTTLKFKFTLTDPEDEPTAEARLIYRPVIKPWADKKKWPVEDIIITTKVW